MPSFDRAAAKAAGYSDAEIEQIISAGPPQAQANPAESRIAQLNEPMTSVMGRADPATQRMIAGSLPMVLGAAGTPAGPLGMAAGAGGGKLLEQQLLREVGMESDPGMTRMLMGDRAPQGAMGQGMDVVESAGIGSLFGLGGNLVKNIGGPVARATLGPDKARALGDVGRGVAKTFGQKKPLPSGVKTDISRTARAPVEPNVRLGNPAEARVATEAGEAAAGKTASMGGATSSAERIAVNPAEARIAQAAKPRPKPKLVPKPKPKPKGGNPAEARIAANKGDLTRNPEFKKLWGEMKDAGLSVGDIAKVFKPSTYATPRSVTDIAKRFSEARAQGIDPGQLVKALTEKSTKAGKPQGQRAYKKVVDTFDETVKLVEDMKSRGLSPSEVLTVFKHASKQ